MNDDANARNAANAKAAARAALRLGARLHDEAKYFEAHEAWEDAWRVERDPVARTFFQALIQITAAFHKLLVHRAPGAAHRILTRGCAKLARIPDHFLGVNVGAFRVAALECDRAMAAIEKAAEAGNAEEAIDAFDRRLVPRVEFDDAPTE